MKLDPLKQLRVARRLDEAAQHQLAGRHAEARTIYEGLLAEEVQVTNALRGMGILAVLEGQFSAGEEWLRKALAQAPDDARLWNDLGEDLRLMGRADEAIAAFDKALALQPGFPGALNNRGVARMALGDLATAADDFQAAIGLDPNHAHAHNNLGVLLERQGNLSGALLKYEAAVILKPDFQDALDNYATLLEAHPEMLADSVSRLVQAVERRSE